MRRFLILITVIGACLPIFADRNHLLVYRNDSTFNQMTLTESDTVSHIVKNGKGYMHINDLALGDTLVPLNVVDMCEFRESDIPVLRFSFPDYPDAAGLWEKELYVNANLDIEGNGFTDDALGLELKVKGRGNTTWGMPKKPMRLKFSKKTSICGFKKAKNFVLLNNYIDPTLMKNSMSMYLANRLGVKYANTMVPCHVFINGHYAGAYTLTEKIGINSSSVDIEETEGILLEMDVAFDENYKFRSETYNLPVMVKDPDFDELYEADPDGLTPSERLDIWKADYNKAEKLVQQGRGAEAFDLESAVNYYLLYQLVYNPEVFWPKSFYIHKASLNEGEKYQFGPAWDFDISFNFYSQDGIPMATDLTITVPRVLGKLTLLPEFKSLYQARLKYLRDEVFDDFLEYFDSYAELIKPSAKLNGVRWSKEGPVDFFYLYSSFDTDRFVGEMRDWIIKRANFLFDQIEE